MGKVDAILAGGEIGPRDIHNRRLFVDISESVHIHYREYRLVLSPEEYRHFASVIADGARALDARPDYAPLTDEQCRRGEQQPPEIIGGSSYHPMPLDEPKRSYFDDRVVVERLTPGQIDAYHVHYRDLRIAFNNRDNLLRFCELMGEAGKRLCEST